MPPLDRQIKESGHIMRLIDEEVIDGHSFLFAFTAPRLFLLSLLLLFLLFIVLFDSVRSIKLCDTVLGTLTLLLINKQLLALLKLSKNSLRVV